MHVRAWGVQGAGRAGQARRGPPLLCTRGAPVHLGFRRVLPRGFASVSRRDRPASPVPATCSLTACRSTETPRFTRTDSIDKYRNYYTIDDFNALSLHVYFIYFYQRNYYLNFYYSN